VVEIDVAFVDATLVDGLLGNLRRLFGSSVVSYDGVRKRISVGSEWESRSFVAVIEAVQRWIDESGAASALLPVGNRSYTLLGPSLEAPAVEVDHQVRALATISAFVRLAHGADDSVTLLGRICESISQTFGFERAGIARTFADDDPAEVIAAHGWPLRELTDFVASVELHAILSEAEQTGALVHTHVLAPTYGTSTVVVVPLVTAGRCHGFLLADQAGAVFGLNRSQMALLSTLGEVISALLEKAIAHDNLLRASELKTDFIALASHEIRSPTATVCGIAATLHTRGDLLTAEQRRGLSRALYEQGQRLHRVVDQLLDLSRLDATSIRIAPTPLAVRERTDEIVRGVAGERADEIEIRIDPALLMQADADAFDHIVSNLITNALRYGRHPIAVSAQLGDHHFRLAVEDRGSGVPRELEPRLFDRFTRGDNAAQSGAGLGLSIARAYAHAHGGDLAYENATPHGARFELVIPVAPARPTMRTSQQLSQKVPDFLNE
jgi:K+-sensing histidine kinase KdpD